MGPLLGMRRGWIEYGELGYVTTRGAAKRDGNAGLLAYSRREGPPERGVLLLREAERLVPALGGRLEAGDLSPKLLDFAGEGGEELIGEEGRLEPWAAVAEDLDRVPVLLEYGVGPIPEGG